MGVPAQAIPNLLATGAEQLQPLLYKTTYRKQATCCLRPEPSPHLTWHCCRNGEHGIHRK